METHRVLPRFYEREVQRQRKIARVVMQSAGEVKVTARASAAGDRRQLRGIPVCGGNVGGSIAGTVPHVEALK